MTIVVTGGGSGGHITPLLAVAAELKKLQPDLRVVYIGQRGDRFAKVLSDNPIIDESYTIWAGKWRRYHGEGFKQLLDLKTLFLNVRDMILASLGLLQSIWLLGRLKPAVIFIKGGFVGVPVGLAAAMKHIPYVTHDSDAISGLANRIISRWASKHAVALPKDKYNYPESKTVVVGVPISDEYTNVDDKLKAKYRSELGLTDASQVIFVTGGGLGALIINESMVMIAPSLLETYPGLYILHATGQTQYDKVSQAYDATLSNIVKPRLITKDYINDLYKYSGAADIVIARAGATNMAEMAAQGKACIIVPNPALAGGHQLKNAQAYAEAGAISLVDESILRKRPETLSEAIKELLDSSEKQSAMGTKLHAFSHPNSAHELAVLLLEEAQAKP